MPLTGLDAVNQLAGALVRAGFQRRKRSKSGSQYLRLPGHQFELRISDHQWSGFSAQRQCQVVCSYVVPALEQARLDQEAAKLKERFLERVRQRLALAGAAP